MNKDKMNKSLENTIESHIKVKKQLATLQKEVNNAINKISKSITSGGKILFCGNGGSAADAQHLAAELIVKLGTKKRKSLPAISLALDTSTITACANDFDYKYIFSRALEGIGSKKDILVVISTSGNSKNILEVLKKAKKKGIYSIGLLGNSGGKSKKLCNLSIIVNNNDTQIIQECHIFLGHFIFGEVEKKLFKKKNQKKSK